MKLNSIHDLIDRAIVISAIDQMPTWPKFYSKFRIGMAKVINIKYAIDSVFQEDEDDET